MGTTVVEALHDEHELTVLDLDESRLAAVSQRRCLDRGGQRHEPSGARLGGRGRLRPPDRVHVQGRGEHRRRDDLQGGRASRDDDRPHDQPRVPRGWHEGQLDVDFIVSSELETAHAVVRTIAVPAARQTDVFAEGQVQLVEFDVDETADPRVLGVPLREMRVPPDSRVAGIIRGDTLKLPGETTSSNPATGSS